MAPLGVVGHCEERLLACIRYPFPIPGAVGKEVGSGVGWLSPQELQNIEAGGLSQKINKVFKGEYAVKAIYAPNRYARNTVRLTAITEDWQGRDDLVTRYTEGAGEPPITED